MKSLKPALIKRPAKQERERQVLFGLVRHYIKTGKPVGSHTLQEAGFDTLSSATIRNYFSQLEQEGFLIQQHSSGGRIPTYAAYRLYATEYGGKESLLPHEAEVLDKLRQAETREIAAYLQQVGETLSRLTNLAVFVSAPRFDHDFIVEMKVVPIDTTRCLCAIVTDFGVVQSEVLSVDVRLSAHGAKRIESYFHWRLTGHDEPELEPEELALAQKMYNEVMLRYIVSYSNFVEAALYRTGFSRLLTYPEFRDSTLLGNSLSLFENLHTVRMLIKGCCKEGKLKVWIGDELTPFAPAVPDCTVMALPYHINQNIVGAIGLLGPTRIPYPELVELLHGFTHSMSEALTRNLYKFKITFRQPHHAPFELGQAEYQPLLLEAKD